MSDLRYILAILSLTFAASGARADEPAADPLPQGAKLLDGGLIMYSHPYPTIAPDGKHVAYVSRGYVCVAAIDSGEVQRLFEVPESWSHFLALPENDPAHGSFQELARQKSRDEYNAMLKRIKKTIFSLKWSAESDAVFFGIQSYDLDNNGTAKTVHVHIWQTPLTGDAKEIASSHTLPSTEKGLGADFRITTDRRFLVANDHRRPLVWNLSTNMPRAAPYLYMAPSPTSGRWIAVEKDTRQLVALDEDLNVAARYEEFAPKNEYGFDMVWSPDERYVIWRQQIGFDHYSNWVGCRYDLQSRERTILTGDYWGETIVFTGKRGEFLRIGNAGKQRAMSGLELTANFIQIVPDASPFPHDVWRVDSDIFPDQAKKLLNHGFNYPIAIAFSPNFDLFVIGVPRQEAPFGQNMHLIDGKRHIWRLSLHDSGTYDSPYHVAGFAENGTSLIGYDDKRLFVVPLSTIQLPENVVRGL